MKKVLGIFITIFVFVLNFLNMTFANTEKLSKPPRVIKNKADTSRINLQTGKPIPANKPTKVFPKVEMNDKLEDVKWEMNLKEEVFPKVEMNDKID